MIPLTVYGLHPSHFILWCMDHNVFYQMAEMRYQRLGCLVVPSYFTVVVHDEREVEIRLRWCDHLCEPES